MPVKTKGRKPRNPKTKPFFPHATGYWAAKIAGKTVYLCRWDTPLDQIDEIYQKAKAQNAELTQDNADAAAVARHEELSVRDLANLYLTRRARDVERKELAAITWDGYKRALKWIVNQIGDRSVSSLTPQNFTPLNDMLAGQYGSSQHEHIVSTMRMVFRWAEQNDHIDRAPRYGTAFRGPGERRRRQERATKALKLFTAVQLRKLIEIAEPQMKAMILLGINCAYLQSDCAELPIRFNDNTRNELNLGSDPFIRFDRPKTGVRRKCTLWPETVEALKEVIGDRTDGFVFLTRRGKPLVHTHKVFNRQGSLLKLTNCDAVGKPFRELCKRSGCYVAGIGFSSFRTTFETRAWSTQSLSVTDQAVIHWIMGHKLSGPDTPRLADQYLQDISSADLHLVTDKIRNWFLHEDG